MEKMNIANCFCTEEFVSGNPAAIIQDFNKNSDEKQKLAKKLNLPVTVFVQETPHQLPRLEFFYPHIEMPLCLHGSLAAAYTLFKQRSINELDCTIKSGQIITLRKKEDAVYAQVSTQKISQITVDKTEVCHMLGLKNITEIVDDLPFSIFSVGSSKLLVPLSSLETLAQLTPNFDLIKKWSIANQVNGLYAYVKNPQNASHFYARGFNPKGGHNEDAATGVAAAALALALKQDITVNQGQFIQRPSKILVFYTDPENILVGGKVMLIS